MFTKAHYDVDSIPLFIDMSKPQLCVMSSTVVAIINLICAIKKFSL